MVHTALLIALVLSASPESGRPVTVAVTYDGTEAARPLWVFLRARVADSFSLAEAPPNSPSASDFHLHLTTLPDGAFSVRIEEAGAKIAQREIAPSLEHDLDVWLAVKAALRRALLAHVAGPPSDRVSSPAPNPIEAPPLRSAGGRTIAVRALGGVDIGALGIGGSGTFGAELGLDILGLPSFLGLEVGFARAQRPDAALTIERVPTRALAGVWLSQALPIAAGLLGSLEWERALQSSGSRSYWRARLGGFLRSRTAIGESFGLIIDARVEVPTPRLRYLTNEATITEAPIAIALAGGMEWRWR